MGLRLWAVNGIAGDVIGGIGGLGISIRSSRGLRGSDGGVLMVVQK